MSAICRHASALMAHTSAMWALSGSLEHGLVVGYGGSGGVRAVESLRLVMGELKVADVRAQVQLSMFTDFENFSVFKPGPTKEKSVNDMLDEVIVWGTALKKVREEVGDLTLS